MATNNTQIIIYGILEIEIYFIFSGFNSREYRLFFCALDGKLLPFKKEQDKGRCAFVLRHALHRRAKPVGSDVAGAVLVL